MDTDKALHVILITDSFEDYEQNAHDQTWNASKLSDDISQRVKDVRSKIFSSSTGLNEVFHLIVFQGLGRYFSISLEKPELAEIPLLTMQASDLETISHIESRDPLLLFNYFLSKNHIRDRSKVYASSILDEFGFYRKHNFSYYSSDKFVPGLIQITPGYCGAIRNEAASKHDAHAVQSFSPGKVIEVVSCHRDRAIPIYTPFPFLKNQYAFFVEGFVVAIWVVSEEFDSISIESKEKYFLLCETISYWLWQAKELLNSVIWKFSTRPLQINFKVIFDESNEGEQTIIHKESDLPPYKIEADSSEGLVLIKISSSISKIFLSPDNGGERELIRDLIKALRCFPSEESQAQLTDDAIENALNLFAPLGKKKKSFTLDTNLIPELDPSGLSHPRYLNLSVQSHILDKVGDFLLKSGLEMKPIPDEKRTEVINSIVKFLFGLLEKLITSLKNEGLLEYLVLKNESLIKESAFQELTTPTRIACFSSVKEMIELLTKEDPKIAEAAVSNRFLIEYTVACPPNGCRPISLSVYDELLAISQLICGFGIDSDLIRYQLVDYKVTFLKSERIGFDRLEADKIRRKHFKKLSRSKIESADRSFERKLTVRKSPSDKPKLADELDSAFVEEFGHSMTELASFFSQFIDIGFQQTSGFSMMPYEVLVNKLATSLGWTKEKLIDAIELFCLKPRSHYLVPPTGFTNSDVFPWRYNRGLSYLRKPLLLRESPIGCEVVWGHRNVHTAFRYLQNLCFDAELKAKSRKMKIFLSKFQNTQSKGFNDTVANFFEGNERYVVRRRIDKFNGMHVSNNAGTLGDIDVVVADRNNRKILCLECKRISAGFMPHQIDLEMNALVRGEHGRPSTVLLHQRRTEWIKNNLEAVLKELGLGDSRKWTIEAMIVLSEDLFSAHLAQSEVPICTFSDLIKRFSYKT